MQETQLEIETSTVYRALTGLENARGERVELGEILPREFVPQWQLDLWLAQHDIMIVFDEREQEREV